MTEALQISEHSWDAVLTYCRAFDVEEGETTEYMYSVRKSTGNITLWTRAGWREGWYMAKITGHKAGKKIKLKIEEGTVPVERKWPDGKLEMHFRELISRLTSEVA